MDLMYRVTEERDLAGCFAILEDRFGYSDALWGRLPSVAARLLAEGAMNSAVLEDLDRPPGERLIQFGATVFLTDAFMREAAADMAPHLGAHIIEEILAGRSPVLSLPQIRSANSGDGLNLFALHFGLSTRGVNPGDILQVYARTPESFFYLHQGYNLKEILLEFCGEETVQFSLASGFHLRTDYDDYYRRRGVSPPDRRPHRLGITRSESAADPGTYIGRIFPYQRPQFFFAAGEQQLLLRALQGETDEEAAGALHVAVPTVKTRWRAIYDRVQDRTPDLLPAAGGSRTTRGGEKRRLLLNYLRQHPEELRPVREESRSVREESRPVSGER